MKKIENFLLREDLLHKKQRLFLYKIPKSLFAIKHTNEIARVLTRTYTKCIINKNRHGRTKNMKWLIASDIHGSSYYCEKLINAFNKERADKMILLGDILYHGPRNDLPRDYAPKKVIEMLNAVSKKLLCVRGNCDCEVDQMVLDFPVLADYAILDLGDRCAFLTHGHVYNLKNLPPLSSGDLLIHGHTHVPACEKLGDITYINPGSVSIPKENSHNGYITLENRKFVWKSLDGEIIENYAYSF